VSDPLGSGDAESKKQVLATLRLEARIEIGNQLRAFYKPPEGMSAELEALIAKIKDA
jgi:hypothetical protein